MYNKCNKKIADKHWRQIDEKTVHELADSVLLTCQFSPLIYYIDSMHSNQNPEAFMEIDKLILKCYSEKESTGYTRLSNGSVEQKEV